MSHYMFSTSSWCRSMRLSEPTAICFWHTEVGQQQGYLQQKVLHPWDPEFTWVYIILLPFTHLPCTVALVASAPGCVFHLWQAAIANFGRLLWFSESENQSNLPKLAIAAPFRGILTDWLANWLIFRHLNFKSVPKHGYFAHFDLQTWSYCRWETL